jgi:large conductance mechanosensitive channel
MIQEFLTFLNQYNVVWLAIWLLIGVKVGELVKSLIDNLITPLILNPILTKLKVKEMGDLSYKWILYGKVMSSLIDFIVVALIVFFVVKYMNVPVK